VQAEKRGGSSDAPWWVPRKKGATVPKGGVERKEKNLPAQNRDGVMLGKPKLRNIEAKKASSCKLAGAGHAKGRPTSKKRRVKGLGFSSRSKNERCGEPSKPASPLRQRSPRPGHSRYRRGKKKLTRKSMTVIRRGLLCQHGSEKRQTLQVRNVSGSGSRDKRKSDSWESRQTFSPRKKKLSEGGRTAGQKATGGKGGQETQKIRRIPFVGGDGSL